MKARQYCAGAWALGAVLGLLSTVGIIDVRDPIWLILGLLNMAVFLVSAVLWLWAARASSPPS